MAPCLFLSSGPPIDPPYLWSTGFIAVAPGSEVQEELRRATTAEAAYDALAAG